jgi:hypothetical protein
MTARDMRIIAIGRQILPVRVANPYKAAMSMMLICPKCRNSTELRGTMDSWYLTWCPECERLWRLELWTLLRDDEQEPTTRRTRSPERP